MTEEVKEEKVKKESLMNIEIDRKILLKFLSTVKGIVNRKSYIPILTSALFTAKENGIEVITTDLEIWFQDFLPARIMESGSIAIPIQTLFNFVRELSSPIIKVSEKETNWVEISGGSSKFKFAGYLADDFPIPPESKDMKMVEMDESILSEMIRKTSPFVSTEGGWKNLQNILMEIVNKDKEDFLRMIATDGHRLSLVDKKIFNNKGLVLEKGILIPKKGLMELNKILLKDGKQKKNQSKGFGLLQNKKAIVSLGIR